MKVNLKSKVWSTYYQLGLDTAVCFGYIPEFRTDKDKEEFFRGLHHGIKQKYFVNNKTIIL